MRIYGLKTCDTCRKAIRALGDAEFIDIREDPLSGDLKARALAEFGEDLVNRRSTTWRGLAEADRARAPANLLSDHPALMKRPLLEHEGQLYLGWSKEVQAALGV